MNDTVNIPDVKERERALDPGQSFIVQAPAGSGKTELLTQRYLRLLTCVNAPEEVVAITFTRKAAAEMRGRILGALHKAQIEPEPDKPHEKLTWRLASAVCQHDKQHGWNIQQNPTRLRIQTIDSLCAAITRQMPILSRFGAQPGIVEDANELYRKAARDTLALLETGQSWSDSVAALLRHLDNNLAEVENLLASMLARRDQWLRHVADRTDPRIQRHILEQALANLVSDELSALRSTVCAGHVDEILALARYGAENIKAAGGDARLIECLDLMSLPGSAPEDLSKWQGIVNLLLTSANDWRKKVDHRNGFPAPSGTKDREEKARFKGMKERFAALRELLAEEERLRSQLANIVQLPHAEYEDAQWQIIEALIELLPLAVAQLRLVFSDQGNVDFTEISQAAPHALGDPQQPTDLALALDYRIQHLLVDEFQDTSFSQFELLERLTAGWESGDGRTLFVVGDPMQSIYRFREAEVGLYLRARHKGVAHIKLVPLTLSVNFRSQKAVVDWVNQAFTRVFPKSEDIGSGAVTYTESVAFHPNLEGQAVEVHPLFGKDWFAEADKVVELVRAAKQRDPKETIAILVRGRAHVAAVVPGLKEAGFMYQAIEIEQLGHRPVIQDLLALTRAMIHPADRVAWLAILRAPWCGLSLADLHALVDDDFESSIWDQIRNHAQQSTLSEDGRRRLSKLYEILDVSLAQRRRQSLRRWVEGTWLAIGGPACVSDETDLEDAMVFFELLEQMAQGDDLDIHRMEEKVAALYALPDVEADESLQIMTIHKAKGLEFDTVIVPGLGRKPRNQDNRLLMWLERPRGRDHSDLLLAPIKERGGDDSPIYTYLKKLDEEKGRYENGRLLYVAATRAKKHLHLIGHTKVTEKDDQPEVNDPQANTLLYQLWPVVRHNFTQATPPFVEQEQATETTQEVISVEYETYIKRLKQTWKIPEAPPCVSWVAKAVEPIQQPEIAVEFDWAGETAKQVGIVVHQMLQQIGRQGLETWEVSRIRKLRGSFSSALTRLGVPQDELSEASQRVCNALEQTLLDEKGQWILGRHQEARCEYPLTGVHKNQVINVVIDRTFVDKDGIRWIIDYKTSAHEGGGTDAFLDRETERYQAQLERYAILISRIDPRPIQLGLYFPLLKGWRQWTMDIN